MPFDLMQYVDEEIEESHPGGGSFICQFSLGAGYLVYVTGDRAKRYFEVNAKTDRDEQKRLATEMAAKSGVDAKGKPNRPNFVFTVYLYADSVLNRDTPNWVQAGPGVWAHDLPVWGEAYKDVVRPSVTAFLGDNFEPYTKYWGQIDLVPDPYNLKNGKDKRVPQIAQVFASEEEARKAVEAGGGTVAPRLPEKPENFNEVAMGSWGIFVQDVLSAIARGDDGTEFLSAENGFRIEDYMKVLAFHEETFKKDEITF